MSQNERSDSVYHLTALSNLDSIRELGLLPNPEHDGIELRKELDRAVDDIRPIWVIARGISRASAVYAYSRIDRVTPYSMGARGITERGGQSIVVEISVDADEALVLDAAVLDKVRNAIVRQKSEGRTEESDALIQSKAKAYWNTAITLREYKALYDLDDRIRLDKSLDNPMPYYYAIPEILVPGPVKPEAVARITSLVMDKTVALE